MKIRIGTRGSDLALWQANHVAARLRAAGCEVEIDVMKTRGDLIDDVPLQNVEGKAFFTAEIEQALLDDRVDIAVHSHKDLPVEGPERLAVVAVPERAPAQERLLIDPAAFAESETFLPLRRGARVGTSSPRRAAQLSALRQDLQLLDLRGNVPTRVRRLREGRYDAILLAAAGLERLQLNMDGLQTFDPSKSLLVPAPGQGALAIQTRVDDRAVIDICRETLHDETTERIVRAERRLLTLAGGGCNLALGASIEAVDGEAERWRACVFRGPDASNPDRPARWATVERDDPTAAVEAAFHEVTAAGETREGPLAELRVALTGASDGRTVLGERLRSLGAAVVHERVIRCEDIPGVNLAGALATLRAGDAIAVTSRVAARRLNKDEIPAGVLVAAVGRATASALAGVGIEADVVGDGGALALAQRLPVVPSGRVVHPCSETALTDLQDELEARGIEVERIHVYRTVPATDPELSTDVDVRIYMSPSSVEACVSWERDHPTAPVLRIALGPTTIQSMEAAGLSAVAASGDSEDVIRVLSRRQDDIRVRA